MIEIMRKEDLAQIVDLEKKCFNDAWNLEQVENELEVLSATVICSKKMTKSLLMHLCGKHLKWHRLPGLV